MKVYDLFAERYIDESEKSPYAPPERYVEQKTYRERLVDMVRATGEYISENADKLVDGADLKRDFTITVLFRPFEYPEIVTEQSHAMKNVLEVMND